jgi:hypothetical protein
VSGESHRADVIGQARHLPGAVDRSLGARVLDGVIGQDRTIIAPDVGRVSQTGPLSNIEFNGHRQIANPHQK